MPSHPFPAAEASPRCAAPTSCGALTPPTSLSAPPRYRTRATPRGHTDHTRHACACVAHSLHSACTRQRVRPQFIPASASNGSQQQPREPANPHPHARLRRAPPPAAASRSSCTTPSHLLPPRRPPAGAAVCTAHRPSATIKSVPPWADALLACFDGHVVRSRVILWYGRACIGPPPRMPTAVPPRRAGRALGLSEIGY